MVSMVLLVLAEISFQMSKLNLFIIIVDVAITKEMMKFDASLYSMYFRVSNLADIFEADETEQTSETNPSLKYIPPKPNQFQKPSNTSAEKPKWDVAIAKIVCAYKLYVYKSF